MMIICLPVLPGLLRRRGRHRGRSHYHVATTFSNRAGSKAYPRFAPSSSTTISDKNVEGEYLELAGRPSTSGGLGIPELAVLNHVRGGDEKDFDFGLEGLRGPSGEMGRPGGIVKTVTVEQSRA